MPLTDLKFFTNEPERDLYSRFAAILRSNTQFFDVLVGYFRASGFFKMCEALESVEKIRILVGLNVDLAAFLSPSTDMTGNITISRFLTKSFPMFP